LRKELKRQIREDEFRSGLERAARWLAAHRDEARITAGVLVVVAAIGGGLAFYDVQRRRQAAAAFTAAMDIFRAPVEAELKPGADRPARTSYATAEDKFKKAAAAFDGVERRYASLAVAERARYYGALSRMGFGAYDEAEAALKEEASRKSGDAIEPALARLALAELYRRRGEREKAVQAYRDLASDGGLPLPRDHALMSLGSLLEQMDRLAEAESVYRRVTEEFPTGVYAAEARRRLTHLRTTLGG
jgi:TolA-binding protein